MSWEIIGSAVVAAVTGGVGFWRRWGRSWLAARKAQRNYDEVLENSRLFVQMGVLLREWRASAGAQRVLLLYARNSGTPWPIEHPVRVSNLIQACDTGVENTWRRWQDWEIDPPYREMLGDVLQAMRTERSIMVRADKMPSSILKDAYVDQGTTHSVLFGLRWLSKENALVYVSFNFDNAKAAHELFDRPERVRRKLSEAKEAWKSR